jgi:hypothetical protein
LWSGKLPVTDYATIFIRTILSTAWKIAGELRSDTTYSLGVGKKMFENLVSMTTINVKVQLKIILRKE